LSHFVPLNTEFDSAVSRLYAITKDITDKPSQYANNNEEEERARKGAVRCLHENEISF